MIYDCKAKLIDKLKIGLVILWDVFNLNMEKVFCPSTCVAVAMSVFQIHNVGAPIPTMKFSVIVMVRG